MGWCVEADEAIGRPESKEAKLGETGVNFGAVIGRRIIGQGRYTGTCERGKKGRGCGLQCTDTPLPLPTILNQIL